MDDADALADFAAVATIWGSGRFARIRCANKERWRNWWQTGCRSRWTRCFVRCAHQAHPRIQAPTAQYPREIALYNEMRARPMSNWMPRVKIFAGKAAAELSSSEADHQADQRCGNVINGDPAVHGLLKVVFIPDYNVSLAEMMIPPRPVRADFDRGYGGIRAQAT